MRQNVTIVLLSVIATLLFIVVVQNLSTTREPMLAQTGGGAGATVGVVGVATGTIMGADAAGFWIYHPGENKLMLYDYGNRQLRLKAVRDISYDIKATDFNLKGQVGPTVADVKKSVEK